MLVRDLIEKVINISFKMVSLHDYRRTAPADDF